MEGLPASVAELGQYGINVHPRVLCFADDHTVAAPGVAVQFFDCLDNAGPDGIEMDVADKGEKIVVFVAENGFKRFSKRWPVRLWRRL